MTNREILAHNGYVPDDYVLFENPSFDGAVVGISTDDRVIYDYDLMIEAGLRENPDWTIEDTIDWIEYNTIRSLSYIPDSPIIQYKLFTEDEE